MSEEIDTTAPVTADVSTDPRRWWALALLGLVQFMLALDMTVVNVALPRIQETLGVSDVGLAWIINGYVLVAGGLLLLGGRLADAFGRRRMFVVGVMVFAIASITCGAAVSAEMLVISRFVQGLGEALAAPAALGIIVLMFTDPGERTKALGIWGGLTGLGGTVGTVVSGSLTDLVSWRWIFYINIPVAILVLALVIRLVPRGVTTRGESRFDLAGAVTATGGLLAVVYGLLQAAHHAWGSPQVLLPLIGGAALIAVMIVIESRSAAPLIPLSFFRDRTRVSGYVVVVLHTAVFFSYLFLITLYMQNVLGYSPLAAGAGFLPLGLGVGAGIGASAKILERFGLKLTMIIGFVVATGGLLLTTGITTESSFAGGLLPGMLLFALATGILMPATMSATLNGLRPQDSGLGSALQGVMQQMGGALGLALMVAIALRMAGSAIASGSSPEAAATGGYVSAFQLAAALMVVAALVAAGFIRREARPVQH